jgi:hypothetical protein
MIHYLTVHWKQDLWIDKQLESFKRFTSEPWRSYAFLNEIDSRHYSKFDYVSDEPIEEHAIKLNLLADIAIFNAQSDDDLLCFIDGDAFLIGDYCGFAREQISRYPLLAVRRDENNGDVQPHPCFALTTVGFWRQLKGDWKMGYRWDVTTLNQTIQVTDVGGNLLGLLREKQITWLPILRSNTANLHPLWFGIYGGFVYHHGASFRSKVSRRDYTTFGLQHPFAAWLFRQGFDPRSLRYTRRPMRVLFRALYSRKVDEYIQAQEKLSKDVWKACETDPQFVQLFQEKGMTEERLRQAMSAVK